MFGILLLIVLNLAVGYAFALYLHRPDLLAMPLGLLPGESTQLDESLSMLTAPSAPSPPAMRTTPIPAQTPAIAQAARIEAAVAPPDPTTSQPPPVQDAVLAFKAELSKYCSDVEALDEQMREHSAAPDSADVQACVKQFQALSDRYLEQQEQSVQALQLAQGAASEVTQPCLAAAQEHTAAVAATRAELANAAALADAAAACREFLLGTGRLAGANQSLHAELDRTLERISAPEPTREELIDDNPPAAAQPEPADSASLERAIAEFVRIQASPGGKFSVALIEPDQLASINRKLGRPVADRIIDAVVQTFVALAPRSTVATDKERQQFLYFQAETSARETTNGVEQVRQRIEAATFQHGNTPIRVTLSGGVAEASYEEEPLEIIKRLQEMLHEAQRYGRNRTFFQEGQQSAPAIPAVVQVEKRVIEI